jgi:nicotinate (nicotinamide) nucleotide adenylyltransferase
MPDRVELLAEQINHLRRLEESSILLFRKAPQGISRRHGRLGIFAASFNPPTQAHLALIRRAIRLGNLDEMLVLLDAQAMDKEITGAPLEDRLIMLKKLFQRNPKVSIGISNRGLFVEKLLPLRRLYPLSAGFVFVVGFDTAVRIMDKKYYPNRNEALDKLFGLCEFLVANREGDGVDSFEDFFAKEGNRCYRDKVSLITLSSRFSFHSSSLVREKITEGHPVDDLVPRSILQYIKERGLYTPT